MIFQKEVSSISKKNNSLDLILNSSPYDCLNSQEKLGLKKRVDLDISLNFLRSNQIRGQKALQGNSEAKEVNNIISAKKMLEYISRNNEFLFRRNNCFFEGGSLDKQTFFNSSLIYLIAATDVNEDSIGHSKLVARYSVMLTRALGIDDLDFLLNIERGALLHDIGKIGIPERILRKPGALTLTEKEIIKEHPLLGYEVIEEFDFLQKAARVVLFHHEKYDGTGYVYGLTRDEIPLEARIFSVADTLDAITSDRAYQKGQSFMVGLREIEEGRGSQFDPQVVDAFFSIPEERWEEVKADTQSSFWVNTVH